MNEPNNHYDPWRGVAGVVYQFGETVFWILLGVAILCSVIYK